MIARGPNAIGAPLAQKRSALETYGTGIGNSRKRSRYTTTTSETQHTETSTRRGRY